MIRILGLRRSALIEIALFIGVALAFDAIWLGGNRLLGIQPHPFWAIVLLIAVQYGTAEGLTAAAACSAALLAGHVPEQHVSADLYDYLWQVTRLPMLWFCAAGGLGELRRRHIRETESVRRKWEEASAREREITTAFERLNGVKNSLENLVATQMGSTVALYQAARHLERLDPLEVLNGVAGLVKATMGPRKFSLFLLDGDCLLGALQEGWDSAGAFPWVYGSQAELFRRIVGGRQVLCVSRREDELVLGKDGVLAGPLIVEDTGEIVGMLKIERMAFLSLNLSSVQSFQALCGWVAAAYSNARGHTDLVAAAAGPPAARRPAVSDPEFSGSLHALFARVEASISRAARSTSST